MIRITPNTLDNLVLLYVVVIEENTPYMCLHGVEYRCTNCEKHAKVDLSLVPPHNLFIQCGNCQRSLWEFSSQDFQLRLFPKVSTE